jgi:hypothetical protein
LRRVRSHLVGERTAITNEICAFLLDRGIAASYRLGQWAAARPGLRAQNKP